MHKNGFSKFICSSWLNFKLCTYTYMCNYIHPETSRKFIQISLICYDFLAALRRFENFKTSFKYFNSSLVGISFRIFKFTSARTSIFLLSFTLPLKTRKFKVSSGWNQKNTADIYINLYLYKKTPRNET